MYNPDQKTNIEYQVRRQIADRIGRSKDTVTRVLHENGEAIKQRAADTDRGFSDGTHPLEILEGMVGYDDEAASQTRETESSSTPVASEPRTASTQDSGVDAILDKRARQTDRNRSQWGSVLKAVAVVGVILYGIRRVRG